MTPVDRRRRLRLAAVCGVLVVASPSPAPARSADELRVMVSGGFTAAYRVLAAEWERSTGHRVVTISGASMGDSPSSIPNRLARGEQADVVILARTSLDALAASGHVHADSRIDLAHSRIGMAVRTGAAVPDISSVDRFRRVLLEAASIAYSQSASGLYISTEMFQTLGIADQVAAKSKMVPTPVAESVARGDAQIGFQQISELLPVNGITFAGPIPDAVQRVTIFSAGVAAGSRLSATARELIAYLASPRARETIRRTGLDLADAPHQIALTRVFPNPGQIGLFIAAADCSNERPLSETAGFDCDATWSPYCGPPGFFSGGSGTCL